MDFWEWLASSFRRDTAGWIAVIVGVLALVSAPIWWWTPLIGRVRGLIAGRRERVASSSGVSSTGRQPIRSEVYVSFRSMEGRRESYESYGSGELLGGTLTYEIGNHGPLEVRDVRVELIGKEIEARTKLYWPKMGEGAPENFTVHIPFNKDRDVIVHWRHGRRWFERALILPTE